MYSGTKYTLQMALPFGLSRKGEKTLGLSQGQLQRASAATCEVKIHDLSRNCCLRRRRKTNFTLLFPLSQSLKTEFAGLPILQALGCARGGFFFAGRPVQRQVGWLQGGSLAGCTDTVQNKGLLVRNWISERGFGVCGCVWFVSNSVECRDVVESRIKS